MNSLTIEGDKIPIIKGAPYRFESGVYILGCVGSDDFVLIGLEDGTHANGIHTLTTISGYIKNNAIEMVREAITLKLIGPAS